MAEYLRDNPQFIVNGFLRWGTTGAFNGDEMESDDEPGNESFSDMTDGN